MRFLLLAAAFLQTQASVVEARDYIITPFVGWRTSSSLEEEATGAIIDLKETRSFGVILSMQQKPGSYYDFLFSRQNTQLEPSASAQGTTSTALRFDYFHVGGTVFYEHDGWHPFVTGGLGATHISPANDVFSSETRFSLSLGGGLELPLLHSTRLRLEVRGYGTVTDGSTSILCTGGACLAKFRGSLFTQFEASAGLSVGF